jgi:hypothetical protein
MTVLFFQFSIPAWPLADLCIDYLEYDLYKTMKIDRYQSLSVSHRFERVNQDMQFMNRGQALVQQNQHVKEPRKSRILQLGDLDCSLTIP